MNCSMKRDECFRLGTVIIYMQMCISNALEAELSKYTISLKLIDFLNYLISTFYKDKFSIIPITEFK